MVTRLTLAAGARDAFTYRLPNLVAGVATVALLYRLVERWAGRTAAAWAALLLAANEYHVFVSSQATETSFHLFFSAAAAAVFCRALEEDRPGNLPLAGGLVGTAFLFHENASLMMPVFAASLAASRPSWLRRREAAFAAAAFFLVISPDLIWNFANAGSRYGLLANLGRAGGVGFSPQPFMFFLRGLLNTRLHLGLPDAAGDWPSTNSCLGAFLLFSIAALAWRPPADARRPTAHFLTLWFSVYFLFFLVIRAPSKTLLNNRDPQAWIWIDGALLPACAAAGYWLASKGRAALAARAAAVAGLALALLDGSKAFGLLPYRVDCEPVMVEYDRSGARTEAVVGKCPACKADPAVRLTQVVPFGSSQALPADTADLVGRSLVLRLDPGRYWVGFRLEAGDGRTYDFKRPIKIVR